MTRLRARLRRLRREEGFSLMEVLIASSLLIAVLGAALAPFEIFQRTDRVTHNANDSQDNARNTVDSVAHQLRNVAGQTGLIDRASSYDVVFQTIDAGTKPAGSQNDRNVMRVRYCLDTTNAPASPSNGRLWEQDLRWTSAAVPGSMPSAAACPDLGWASSTRRILADYVTNKTGGQSRALFGYFPAASPLSQITSIRVDMFSDRNASESPRETELTSGVLFRNQNGAPTASFTSTPGAAGSKQITLNAAASSDPESLPLTYRWCDTTSVATCDETTKVGSGQLFTYTAPASGTRQILLQVFDIGGLEADAGPTAVTAP
jgi:type II secretory pathway pseudopilin PulG